MCAWRERMMVQAARHGPHVMRTIARLGRSKKTGFIVCKRLQFGVVHRAIAGIAWILSNTNR